MRLTELDGIVLPMPVDVFGWRWPAEIGDRPSKALFEQIDQAGKKKKEDSGIGVFRSRFMDEHGQAGGDWFLWVVDLNYGLLDAMPRLKALKVETVEPDVRLAKSLVMRHLRTTLESWDRAEGLPAQTHTRVSYGKLGAVMDELGHARIRANRG